LFVEDAPMAAHRLIAWQWKNLWGFTWRAAIGTGLAIYAENHQWLEIPAMPLSVVGAAIGIFVAFRSNQAYDRWWEGRKLWGRLINTSRHISSQAKHYLGDADATTFIHRHMAYVHALRVVLRREDLSTDSEFQHRRPTDVDVDGATNVCHSILDRQFAHARELRRQGKIDGFELSDLDESIRHLLDIQGGCERIKNTPLPKGYGFIGEVLIRYYAFILPFTLTPEIHWLAIPATVLVCFAFSLINETGRVLEDPFTTFFNGLPLMALSNTIERDLCTLLNETPPPKTEKINAAVLL